MDLSKTHNTRNRSRSAAVDLARKPEWYHRRPAELSSPSPASSYRTRASSSYGALSSPPPAAAARRRDVEAGPEPLGGFMNSPLAPRLGLYRDGVHGGLWHPGFCRAEQGGGPAPESSGGSDSDSGSDVIFLVSSAKEPLLCGSFLQDGVRHMVEPLSPAVSSLDEGRGCCHAPQPLSSPSPDSSFSEDSSDSWADIPVHHARPVVLVSDLGAGYGAAAASSEDDSDVVEVSEESAGRSGGKPEDGAAPREVRRSSRIRKSSSDTPPLGTRRSLRRRAKNDAVGIYNESGDSDDLMEFVVRSSSSDESPPQTAAPRGASGVSGDDVPPRRPPNRGGASYGKSVPPTRDSSVSDVKKPRRTERKPGGARTRPKAPAAQRKPAARRRAKRRRQVGGPGPFGPREPEIPLRFAKPKEERKRKAEDFCPFVRVERRTCVVVNYQEDRAGAGAGVGRPAAGSPSGFVPNTSCFRPARPGSRGQGAAAPLCCLCGCTANAMGLGDLHGPYRPAPPGPAPAPACRREPRRRREGSPLNAEEPEDEEPHRRAPRCSVNSFVENSGERPAGGAGSPRHSESPPDPLHPDEWWIHEDCGIWSAGVFLVRGRLYGLEEAARLARQAVCCCCRRPGAILGCFQKSCSRSYHYRCAIQSGCILTEENFSMRCPEHKIRPSTKQQHS